MKRRLIIALVTIVSFAVIPCATADMFFDNFDDGNADGWWLGYNRLGHYGNWSVENGSLFQNRPGDGYVSLVENLIVSDQTIETRLYANAPSGYGGLIFWFQDFDNYVSVNVYPSHIYMSEVIGGSNRAASFSYSAGLSERTWYNLRVDADSMSGELAVYVDDAYLFTYDTITTNSTGMAGLFSGNAGGYYDDFRITSDDMVIVPIPPALVLAALGLTCASWAGRRQFNRVERGGT